MFTKLSFAIVIAMTATIAVPAHAMSISSAARSISAAMPVRTVEFSGRMKDDTLLSCLQSGNGCDLAAYDIVAISADRGPREGAFCPISSVTVATLD